MAGLTKLAGASTLAFLGALGSLIVYHALAGKIQLRGLLMENGPGAGRPRHLSAPRAQLLLVTVLVVIAYLALAGDRNGWPLWLSAGLPVVLAVSNTIYIWSQYRRLRAASHS